MIHTNVCAFDGSFRRPEAQSDVFEPSSPSLTYSCALGPLAFRILEDVRLLLKSTLRLHCQLGRHDRGIVGYGVVDPILNFVWEPKVSGISLSSGTKPR